MTFNNYIRAIGIELEGGWTRDRDLDEERIYSDGSVRVYGVPIQGETSCLFNSRHSVMPWLKEWYPDNINHSCGLHIHISTVNNLLYMKLLTREFYKAVINAYTNWGKINIADPHDYFWERLQYGTRHCKPIFKPQKQIHQYEKYHPHRYTQLNFCFPLHHTFEYRALPMLKTPELAFSAVNVLIDTTTKFLQDHEKDKERKHGFKLEVEPDDLKMTDKPIIESIYHDPYSDHYDYAVNVDTIRSINDEIIASYGRRL